jgi:hypothetical protein
MIKKVHQKKNNEEGSKDFLILIFSTNEITITIINYFIRNSIKDKIITRWCKTKLTQYNLRKELNQTNILVTIGDLHVIPQCMHGPLFLISTSGFFFFSYKLEK